jgi:RNA polymerase sigma-70 factor (ECF subfamily)
MSSEDDDPDYGPPSVELARSARSGQANALEALVARHYDRVLAIVRKRLGADLRRFHESGDIVQEAMVQAVRSFERYELEDEDAFLRWISGVVENRIRDLAKLQRAQRRGGGGVHRLGSIDLDQPNDVTPSNGSGPSTLAERRDDDARVREALSKLDERTRKLVEARIDGKSWAEIATELDFPSESAARMSYGRALVKLTQQLES